MTDANIGKTSEAGKAELEHFDVEEAIKEVRRLGRGLIEATRHAKHHFREEWLKQVIQRYRQRPGRPVIHLDDLSDTVMPILRPTAAKVVAGHCNQLFETESSEWIDRHYGNIVRLAKGQSANPAKLRTWRKFSEITGFQINTLEPHMASFRISEGKYTRTIVNPRLPFNLATVAGAKIVGYRGDAAYRSSAFTNKNPILHKDYREAIKEVVGKISFSETRVRGTGFTRDFYIRTNVGRFITTLATVAGLDNTKEQKIANNPAPLWFHACPEEIVTSYLGSVWDAEGSVNFRDIKLRQAVALDHLDTHKKVPYSPGIPVSKLERCPRNQVDGKPPLLLTSSAILLFKLGIASHVVPTHVSRTKSDISAYWQLRISRDRYARIF